MSPPVAAICGDNRLFPATRLGCGQPIQFCRDVYRCTDCTVPFHRECAVKHFERDRAGDPITQADVDAAGQEAVSPVPSSEEAANSTQPPVQYMCGPTCGCGKLFDMVPAENVFPPSWTLPKTCPHCGQENSTNIFIQRR